MQNLDFILSLPEDIFVVSGSYALKMQDKNFRDYTDIDIALDCRYLDFVEFKAKNAEAEIIINGNYEAEVCDITFKDGSKIDCIIYAELPKNSVKSQNNGRLKPLNLFPIKDIVNQKVDLLKQYHKSNESEKYNKHLSDIGYFLLTEKITIS